MTTPVNEILRILQDEDDFIIASHYNPDGDALGSTIALGYILERLGKNFLLYNVTGLPQQYDWLQSPRPIVKQVGDFPAQWFITVDCGTEARAGDNFQRIMAPERTINIDHHLGNPEFGVINWVDHTRSSCGEMVAMLANELNIPLAGPLGEAIYLSMVTDTGDFCYDSTTPESMELAADIIRNGLKPGIFNARIKNQWSLNRIRLWSKVLDQTSLYEQGRIGIIKITRELLKQTGTTIADTDNLIDYVRRIRGVEIAISVREEPTGGCKFSLRSTGEMNVQQIAARFGGGGHRNASGGQFSKPVDVAAAILVDAARQQLAES